MLGAKVEQVNAKVDKCMATAKGTPVPLGDDTYELRS